MFYVYVLRSLSNPGRTYIGYTSDLKRRFEAHNAGQNKSTRGVEWELLYYEAYQSSEQARDRERKLKHDGRVKMFLMKRLTQFE